MPCSQSPIPGPRRLIRNFSVQGSPSPPQTGSFKKPVHGPPILFQQTGCTYAPPFCHSSPGPIIGSVYIMPGLPWHARIWCPPRRCVARAGPQRASCEGLEVAAVPPPLAAVPDTKAWDYSPQCPLALETPIYVLSIFLSIYTFCLSISHRLTHTHTLSLSLSLSFSCLIYVGQFSNVIVFVVFSMKGRGRPSSSFQRGPAGSGI